MRPWWPPMLEKSSLTALKIRGRHWEASWCSDRPTVIELWTVVANMYISVPVEDAPAIAKALMDIVQGIEDVNAQRTPQELPLTKP